MQLNIVAYLFLLQTLFGLIDVTIGAPAGSSAGLHASSPPRSPSRSPSPSRSSPSSSKLTPAMQAARTEAKDQLGQTVYSGALAVGGAMHAAYGAGRFVKGAIGGKRGKMGDGAEMMINGGAAAACMGIICGAQGVRAVKNYYRSKNPASAEKKYGHNSQHGQH